MSHSNTVVWDGAKNWGGMRGEAGLAAMLEQRGGEGWELVNVITTDEGLRFFFKKPA